MPEPNLDKQLAPELLPCPFCGKEPETGITGAPECDNWRYVKCSNDYCPIRYSMFSVDGWNARVSGDVIPKDVRDTLRRTSVMTCCRVLHEQDPDCADALPFTDWCGPCQSRGLLQKYKATPTVAGPTEALPVFRNTKEAMLYAQQNNIPAVIPAGPTPSTPDTEEAIKLAAREIVEMIEAEREPHPEWSKNARRKYRDKAVDIISKHVQPREDVETLVDEVQRCMDQVVEAAVEWHQAGREGAEWFDKAEALSAVIDSLLELRGKPDDSLPLADLLCDTKCDANQQRVGVRCVECGHGRQFFYRRPEADTEPRCWHEDADGFCGCHCIFQSAGERIALKAVVPTRGELAAAIDAAILSAEKAAIAKEREQIDSMHTWIANAKIFLNRGHVKRSPWLPRGSGGY